jgi:hypothetical protein
VTDPWSVTMISAYGRGESLALALKESGFDVQILDFTEALGAEWNRGLGPFPVATTAYLGKQEQFLSEVKALPRGMNFWLPDGPIELSGPMADFFNRTLPAVRNLHAKDSPDFAVDWLKRFMKIWTSPFQLESWQASLPKATFPYADNIGMVPPTKEKRLMSFERYQTLEHKYLPSTTLSDVQFQGARITQLEAESGHKSAYRSAQWIWCLSSEETDRVGVEVAQQIFANKIRRPEWRWISFDGRCDRGPWSKGFPAYSIVINDLHLPWTYANMLVLRWTESDVFQVWLKVPAVSTQSEVRRSEWAEEVRAHLHRRLPLAAWSVDSSKVSLCPHSPVYDLSSQEDSLPGWKNWDWIAPESLARLDLSARLEREAACYNRLVQWRNEQMKKQGARSDNALHAP